MFWTITEFEFNWRYTLCVEVHHKNFDKIDV